MHPPLPYSTPLMSLHSTLPPLPSPLPYPTQHPRPNSILPSPPLYPSLPYHALYLTLPNSLLPYHALPHSTLPTPSPLPCPPVYRTLPCHTPFHSTTFSLPLPLLPFTVPYHTPTPLHFTLPSPFTLTYIYYPSLSYPVLLHSTLPSRPL